MINLTHEIKEVEIILAGLRKLPMEVVEELVQKIRAQAIPQIAATRAAEATKADENSSVSENTTETQAS